MSEPNPQPPHPAGALGPTPGGASIAVHGDDGRPVDAAALAQVEELDDTIFEALEGDASALDRAGCLWRKVRERAPFGLVEESREQYLRRATSITEEYEHAPAETLGKRFAALEVLALMAE